MDKTNAASEVFDKRAQEYQAKYMDVSLYHTSFDVFCDRIAADNAAVLELACGPGNITKYLLHKRPDLHILGIDLAPTMVELARMNNPTAAFEVMDCREIGRLNQQYDAIMCGFCLPYLSKEDAIQLIKDAAGLLQPNGILYISTMEDDYGKSGVQTSSYGDQIYLYYHQADYLMAALQENGFTRIDLHRQDYPNPNGVKTTDLLLLAEK